MWGVVFACLGALAVQEKPVVAPKSALTFERAIPMPGVEGRIDHMAFDPYMPILFVAARDNGTVEVLGLVENKAYGPSAEPELPQGIVYVRKIDTFVITYRVGTGDQ